MPRYLNPILISPTAFKGTLSPNEAARIMAAEVRRKMKAVVRIHPLADGGDGTLEVLLAHFRSLRKKTRVTGPLGQQVYATWAIFPQQKNFPNKTAVIEMAEASGLKLLRGKNRIREATSYGTGELIRAALEAGCKTILLGVGGTACSDGGAGALHALGLKYVDAHGRELKPCPRDLTSLRKIDFKNLDRRLRKVRIRVLCDVKNPLLGKQGSATVFGPQKGATMKDVIFLENFFQRWSSFARKELNRRPGAGAAGGIAFGLAAFAKARLVEGTRFMMETTHWKKAVANAGLILTGEGKLDETSFSGKVIGEIIRHKKSARVMAVCGQTNLSRRQLQMHDLAHMMTLGADGMIHPRRALQKATTTLLRSISL